MEITNYSEERIAVAELERLERIIEDPDISFEAVETLHTAMCSIQNQLDLFHEDNPGIRMVINNVKTTEA